jgi:uncharacterized metal-binding protein
MEETAVEWLRKQIILNSKLRETKTGKISFTIGLSMLDKVIEQAKEMEKEQMSLCYKVGVIDGNNGEILNFENYYKETYNK